MVHQWVYRIAWPFKDSQMVLFRDHHPLYRPVACACMSCSEKWHKKQSPWSLNFKTSPGACQEKKCWCFLKDWCGLEKMLSPMVCNVLMEACKIYLLYPFTVGILELFHYRKCLVIKYWTPKDRLTRMKSSRIWCIGQHNKIWMVRRCSMVVFNGRLLPFEVVYFISYLYMLIWGNISIAWDFATWLINIYKLQWLYISLLRGHDGWNDFLQVHLISTWKNFTVSFQSARNNWQEKRWFKESP